MTADPSPSPPLAEGWKLWFYTNYDCNLSCTYCAACSSPRAPRRALAPATVRQAVDEAAALGFAELFFTGGEPFILPDIYDMLAYASARLPTTVLTNAMVFTPARREKLRRVQNPNLRVQVSLDGARPEQHDPYRGAGTWAKTVGGIKQLLGEGWAVRLSTTETPANCDFLAEICAFHLALGIPESDHFVRPLAKRGFSSAGMAVDKTTLAPELTINAEGMFWHPLSTDEDMRVAAQIFPLACAVESVRATTGAAPAGRAFT